jgi:hypothetical protein
MQLARPFLFYYFYYASYARVQAMLVVARPIPHPPSETKKRLGDRALHLPGNSWPRWWAQRVGAWAVS